MIRVSVWLPNDTVGTYEHPNAQHFIVHEDGDVSIRNEADGPVIAIYVNRLDKVIRVWDPTADELVSKEPVEGWPEPPRES